MFIDSLHGWAGGTTGFYYTTDGGNNWVQAPGATVAPNAIAMSDTLVGWAAGSSGSTGGIFKTVNGGRSWSQQRYLSNRIYWGTATLNHMKNFTTGRTFSPDTGKVVQTTNGGTTWMERTIADSIRQLRRMQFVDSLHGWIIYWTDSGGGLLRTTDGGNTFTMLPIPVLLPTFHFLDSTRGFFVSYTSTYCYKTSNAGLTWTRLGRIYDPMWDDLSAVSVSFVDTLNGWAFGNMFYQGSTQAAIYHTTDGGVSWTRELIGQARGVIGMMLDRTHGWAVGTEGSVFAYRLITSVPEKLPAVPTRSALKQNYPNPFNPSTSIEYEVVNPSWVNITVYDLSGKEVQTLVQQHHEPGVYRVNFNGDGLASGSYIYRMKAGDYAASKQMIILK